MPGLVLAMQGIDGPHHLRTLCGFQRGPLHSIEVELAKEYVQQEGRRFSEGYFRDPTDFVRRYGRDPLVTPAGERTEPLEHLRVFGLLL